MQQVFAFGAFIPCLVKWKQRIEKLQQYCASNAIPAQFIHVDTLEQAKALPCVFNNWAAFYNGAFVTVNQLDAAAVERLRASSPAQTEK